MDPFTFGMVFVGASGGALLSLHLLGKKVQINETAVKLVMEAVKYGTILYLIKVVFTTFL